MDDWHKRKPELFQKRPCYLMECNSRALELAVRHPSLGKGRHARMAGHRRLNHSQRQRRTRAFAKTQAQRQQRLFAQGRKQSAMGAFG